MLADELAKALQRFAIPLSVGGKLVSLLYLSIEFDDSFKVTSAPLFVIDFIYEVVNLINRHLHCYIEFY